MSKGANITKEIQVITQSNYSKSPANLKKNKKTQNTKTDTKRKKLYFASYIEFIMNCTICKDSKF